jgi:hypothetical protein
MAAAGSMSAALTAPISGGAAEVSASASMHQRSFLFLDFDGVLHPLDCHRKLLFCRAGAVEDALMRLSIDVRVVVSSSWRRERTISQLRALLGPLGWRAVGRTAWCGDGAVRPAQREMQCRAWIQKFFPGAQWLALDDQARLFAPDCTRLVVTNGHLGVTAAELAVLANKFAGVAD